MKRPLGPIERRTVSIRIDGKSRAPSAGTSLFIGLMLLGVAGFGSGCTDSISSAPDSQRAALQVGAPRIEMSDLPSSLSLTPEQQRAMQQALDELNAARVRRHEGFQRDDEQHHRRPRAGAGPENGPAFLTFLEQSAEILEPVQFGILAEYLADHPEEWRPMRRDGQRWRDRARARGGESGREPRWAREHEEERGSWREHGMGAKLGDALDLDDAQRESVRDKLGSFREDMRALIRSVETGERSAEAALAEGISRVATMKADLASILTPEQLSKMETLERDHRTRRIDYRLENLDEGLSRRATFLDRVLGLDDAQAQQVRGFLLATVPEREALLRELESGALEPHLAPLRILQLEQSAQQRIRSVLTSEQQARLEMLKDLLPRGFGRVRGG